MRAFADEPGALPGERVEVPVDRRELYFPLVVLGGAYLSFLLFMGWPALGAWGSGGLSAALSELPVGFAPLFAGGVVFGAVALRANARTARTVFTTEGVWQPGWLGGGRFWCLAEVEKAEWIRGKRGITHLHLVAGGRRMRIRVNAFRQPLRIRQLVARYGLERGEVPTEERE